jgi:deoxycytidylate deaminase
MKIHPWMMLAKKESRKSSYKHKIGAVVVSGGSLLSKGYNQIRHAKEFKEYVVWEESLHAERDALRKVKSKDSLVGSTVFIYREHRNGNPATATPCNACFNMIKQAGIKKIFFSTETFPFYAEIKL